MIISGRTALVLLLLWQTTAVLAQRSDSTDRRPGWKIDFDGSGSSPVIADGVLYVGSFDGAVYALDPSNGRLRWRFQTGEGFTSGPQVITVPPGTTVPEMMSKALAQVETGKKEVQATPVVESGTVFVGSRDLNLYALDATTGRKKWAFTTGGMIYTSAIVANGKVYVVSEDAVLYAIDATSGEKRWGFETLPQGSNRRPPGRPLLQGGTVYVTNWPFSGRDALKSYVHAVDPETGQAKWTFSVDGGFVSEPAVGAGLVFFSVSPSDDTSLYAVDAASGDVKWKASVEGSRHGLGRPPTVAGSMVYLETDKTLAAFDVRNGELKWRFMAKDIAEGIAADERFVFVVSYGGLAMMPRGTVHAVDATTGHEAWSAGRSSVVSVQLIQGTVVYISTGGSIEAIDTRTGKKIWSFKTETEVSSRPLISDRTLFVTSTTQTFYGKPPKRGHMYAIDPNTGKLEP